MSQLVSKQELIEFCKDPNFVNYVCLAIRPGLNSWMVELEYTRFKPDTDANENFHLSYASWPEKDPVPQLSMAVVSIDKSGQEYADNLLWKHGLKKAPKGLELITIGKDGSESFFVKGPNVFYLENHSKGAENVAYKNDPKLSEAAYKHEQMLCQRFFDEHKAWIETDEGRKIADAYWAKHPEGRVR